MVPTKDVDVPRVAELPTCQKTLQACAPPMRLTELLEAVMRVGAGLEDEDRALVPCRVEGHRPGQAHCRSRLVDARGQRLATEVTRLGDGRGASGRVVVGRGHVGLRLERHGVGGVDRPVVDESGREPDDGGSGRDTHVAGDDGRAGVRHRRPTQDGERGRRSEAHGWLGRPRRSGEHRADRGAPTRPAHRRRTATPRHRRRDMIVASGPAALRTGRVGAEEWRLERRAVPIVNPFECTRNG